MVVLISYCKKQSKKNFYGVYNLTCLCLQLQVPPISLTPSIHYASLTWALQFFFNTIYFPPILSFFKVLFPVLQVSAQSLSLSSQVMHALVRHPLAVLTKTRTTPHPIIQCHSTLFTFFKALLTG